jgi:hypothetical protein
MNYLTALELARKEYEGQLDVSPADIEALARDIYADAKAAERDLEEMARDPGPDHLLERHNR